MAVKIIRQPDNFLLVGASRGLLLLVNCSEQLAWHNKQKFLETDLRLLQGFSELHRIGSRDELIACLSTLIDEFVKSYGLQRKSVFKGKQVAPILAAELGDIRTLPSEGFIP